MFLCARIIQNFIESIEENELAKVELMDDDSALDYLCKIYENTYGAKPSGVAVFLIRSKFKLEEAAAPLAKAA